MFFLLSIMNMHDIVLNCEPIWKEKSFFLLMSRLSLKGFQRRYLKSTINVKEVTLRVESFNRVRVVVSLRRFYDKSQLKVGFISDTKSTNNNNRNSNEEAFSKEICVSCRVALQANQSERKRARFVKVKSIIRFKSSFSFVCSLFFFFLFFFSACQHVTA